MKVNSEWWKEIFDEVYILTDARSVCNRELTCAEVNFLEMTLKPEKLDPILDLCGGQGRHALELARRGFQNVTVLDYSEYLVDLGIKHARDENLSTIFFRGDARDTGLHEESYRYVIIMASSFGYFAEDNENSKILNEAHRLLMPDGILLLDLPDRDYVVKNLKSFSVHTVSDDITVSRTRKLGEDIIYSRETVTSRQNGCVRDFAYCIRLYSPEKIAGLLYSAGFSSVTFTRDFMCRTQVDDYGCMTNRMVVTSRK
jgi:D-alanine-D-alanine ligase